MEVYSIYEKFSVIVEQIAPTEETLYKMLRHAYEENAELAIDAESKKDPLTDLVGAFMGGQAQAAVDIPLDKRPPAPAPGKAPPPSNGKARR